MFLDEVDAKAIISGHGLMVPQGRVCELPEQAGEAVTELGPAMVKAQVPAGRRGKGGGVVAADTPDDAAEAAARLLGSSLGENRIDRVLVEQRCDFSRELYVAVTIDSAAGAPMLIVSNEGGVDIEEVHQTRPESVHMLPIDIVSGLTPEDAAAAAASIGSGAPWQAQLVDVLVALYDVFRARDAQLVEINPLAVTADGLVALDCKLVIDDNALFRHKDLPDQTPTGTPLERRAAEEGFLLVQLDGDVGVLANGAGLTMSTMDAVSAHGGRPANFLEVGGMAYKRAAPALDLVLSHPSVKSLLVNLCGAYARTDVIADGLVAGFDALSPDIPVAFCIHGTGEDAARQIIRDNLGVEPHETMSEAVAAAVEAAATAKAQAASSAHGSP